MIDLKNGRELFKLALDGDKDAELELVRHGVLLSLEIAKEKITNDTSIVELFEKGFEGWKLAYENYNEKGKHDWQDYVKWWVRNAINMHTSKK